MIQTWRDFTALHGPIVQGEPGRYTEGMNLAVVLTLAARRKPARILEPYCAYGDTALSLAKASPSSRVFAFDLCQGNGYDAPRSDELMDFEKVGVAVRRAPEEAAGRVTLTRCTPDNHFPFIRGSAPYQYVFVDGNHSWGRVLSDAKLALEVADPEGILVFDDYWRACPDVVRFVDEANRRIGNQIVLVEGTRVCYLELVGIVDRLHAALIDLGNLKP